jgi:GntR family transcriptional regulator, rspAB operon transcriptional repressor
MPNSICRKIMPRTKVRSSIRESLSEKAYLTIRNQILQGQLTMGSVLSRRRLATDLGMSMLPICAAIQRLEEEGLVESKPRVGTRVYLPSGQDIREQYIIREALECQAARLVAQVATMQQRQELLRMADQLDALYRRRTTDHDPEFLFAVHGYHMQLHMRIAEFSGSAALRELIQKNSVLVWNWLYDSVAPQPAHPSRFHADLIDAVTGKDVEGAERAMRKHIQFGEEDTIRVIASATTPESRWRVRGSPVAEQVQAPLSPQPGP